MLSASTPACKNAIMRSALRPMARWKGAARRSWRTKGPEHHAALASMAALAARRRFATMRRAQAEPVDPVDLAELADAKAKAADEGAEEESAERVAKSMQLLDEYSEEMHPGHKPGRFAEVGPEFDGMEFDGLRWRMKAIGDGEASSSQSEALMTLTEEDRVLATQYEAEGGLGLCLNRAWTVPDRLRAEARSILRTVAGEAEEGDEEQMEDSMLGSQKVNVPWDELQSQLGAEKVGPVEKAALLLHAADIAEEREAVMRNTWSDIEFDEGEMSNAELVARLERQFAGQLVRSAEVRIRHRREQEQKDGPVKQEPMPQAARVRFGLRTLEASEKNDGIFDMVLKDCQDARDLQQRLPPSELTATLNEPRNLGVALDLIGVYLKNYEIDKCDYVLERVVPLARKRGGTWLIKALDKLCAVRMKQFRAYDALVALKEIEANVPFQPEEGWEFHDIMYRNFAWCYSSLDEADKCLEYTRKSVEVKKTNGVQPTWFDIWDLGKAHARLGQKTQQRDEMKIGFELCVKAGEIHRTAEASDRIMLAKILSNVGEVAMGIGDSFFLEEKKEDAREWYEKAQQPLGESYELHVSSLGPMKPLAGWQAGTMAHCMVRLERWPEAREYLALALRVECTKDSTTNGSLIELLDRVVNCHQELGDMPGMLEYVPDLEQAMRGLRQRGWDRRERDVFAMLLQRISTVLLLADDGKGKMISKALDVLQEAANNLQIFIGEAARPEDMPDEEEVDLNLPDEEEKAKIKKKKFGPQVDNAGELLEQIQTSIKILKVSQSAQPDTEADELGGTEAANDFEEPLPSPPPPPGSAGPAFRRDGLGSLRNVLQEVSRPR
ncbi:unnamed protein product [Effrenium voratum]|uniref:Uncharacterized protein n=1 Tax=Effrenium voratum TaxID=2562239 RepID=A0AA36I1Q5_9DINO|nr:unnamed protein product [Effrenium voratum]